MKKKRKLSRKDTDARWTKKRDETHYGYKNHVKADVGSKLIVDYTATSVQAHDSKKFSKLIKANDKIVYADAGYVGIIQKFSNSFYATVHFCGGLCYT